MLKKAAPIFSPCHKYIVYPKIKQSVSHTVRTDKLIRRFPNKRHISKRHVKKDVTAHTPPKSQRNTDHGKHDILFHKRQPLFFKMHDETEQKQQSNRRSHQCYRQLRHHAEADTKRYRYDISHRACFVPTQRPQYCAEHKGDRKNIVINTTGKNNKGRIKCDQ